MIKENYTKFLVRKEPTLHTKYEVTENEASHLVGTKKKKLYDFYTCDCCKKEIPIKNQKWEEKIGGVIVLPAALTKDKAIKIAVCNKCLNGALKEFEK